MKKIFFLILLLPAIRVFAQTENNDAIKLFIDLPGDTISRLSNVQKTRLLLKITQIVNRTGVAEIGYSNFLVYPSFDILDEQYSEAGIQKLYMAKCQLSLFISRRSYETQNHMPGAVYASESFDVTGSGTSAKDAINNAVNNISISSDQMTVFIRKAKEKIVDYFNKNCEQVMKEADQADKLQQYAKAISLYFSIPSTAPCYETAKGRSVGVYKSYQENDCQSTLIKLKAILASVNNIEDGTQLQRYDEAIGLLGKIDASTLCFQSATKLLTAVEAKFSEEQKKQWQLIFMQEKNGSQYQLQMYKEMNRISAGYRPPNSPANVYINTTH